ncbi:MAG: hypothetical protein ACRDZO_15790 [Egibacteraceae bacterium]
MPEPVPRACRPDAEGVLIAAIAGLHLLRATSLRIGQSSAQALAWRKGATMSRR